MPQTSKTSTNWFLMITLNIVPSTTDNITTNNNIINKNNNNNNIDIIINNNSQLLTHDVARSAHLCIIYHTYSIPHSVCTCISYFSVRLITNKHTFTDSEPVLCYFLVVKFFKYQMVLEQQERFALSWRCVYFLHGLLCISVFGRESNLLERYELPIFVIEHWQKVSFL